MGDVTELATCADCGAVIDPDHDGYEPDAGGDEMRHADPSVCVSHLREKLTAPHFGAQLIAASLAESMKGSENFTEISGTVPGVGDVVITLQKRDGMTPAQKAAAFEKDYKFAADFIAKMREAAGLTEGVNPIAELKILRERAEQKTMFDEATISAVVETIRMGVRDALDGCKISARQFDPGSLAEAVYREGFTDGVAILDARKSGKVVANDARRDLKMIARVLEAIAAGDA